MISRGIAGHAPSLAARPEEGRTSLVKGPGAWLPPPRLAHMKNLPLVFVLLTLAIPSAASGALAESARASPPPTRTVAGTVIKVDEPHRSLVLRNDSGRDITIFWDDATRFAGELKEGALVEAETVERDGRTVAVSIRLRPGKSY
jgi:hypothetical protein